MYNDNLITVVGNLTSDPELTFGSSGTPRARFRLAVNETKKRDSNEEPKTHFIQVTAFRDLAGNIAESLVKGTRVVVVGQLETYELKGLFDDKQQSVTRSGFGLVAETVAPDLRWATAAVTKNSRDRQWAPAAAQAPAAQAPAPSQAPAASVALADDEF